MKESYWSKIVEKSYCAWCAWAKKSGLKHTAKCKGSLVPPAILGEKPEKCDCSCQDQKPFVGYNDYHAVSLDFKGENFIIVG